MVDIYSDEWVSKGERGSLAGDALGHMQFLNPIYALVLLQVLTLVQFWSVLD